MITSLHIVSYRLSTSNHNCRRCEIILDILYLIVFLHQTTTCARLGVSLDDCILSSFYIKPQLDLERTQRSYHCILSSFYIKPQLSTAAFTDATYCILSSFYIKPQPITRTWGILWIVSYRLSTSNHNFIPAASASYIIVSYRLSTSNQF